MTTTTRRASFRTPRADPLPAHPPRSENDPSATVWRPSLRPPGTPADLAGDAPVRSAHGRRWIAGPL